MSKCQSVKIATITSNKTGDVIPMHLRPKTFTVVLANGVGGNVKIEASPDKTVGWTALTDAPLTVSAAVPVDNVRSDDTLTFFRYVSDSFTAGDIAYLYVSGDE